MPEEPQELAANEWGKGGVPAPDGPARFPTGWFETRDGLYAWLAS